MKQRCSQTSACLIFAISLFLFTSSNTYAQEKANENPSYWEQLSQKFNSGSLNNISYLKQVDSLVSSSQVILGDKILKSRLETYKKIAFDNKSFHKHRVNYYDYLSDNAYINNLAGVCIYYAEKKEEELKKVTPYINSLTLLRRQYSIYNRIRGGNKFSGTKSYHEHLPFLEWLPAGIKKDSVPIPTIRNAFLVLQAQANIFAFQEDSSNATGVRVLADKIFDAVKQKYSADKDLIERITAYYNIINEFEWRARKNYGAAIPYMMMSKQITNSTLNTKKQAWKMVAKNNVLIHLVDVYLEYKKIDSAAAYLDSLQEFETKTMAGIGDGSDVLGFTGRLMALKNEYKKAYEANVKSSAIKDSVFAIRTVDINNNLYAQTLAEDKNEELQKAEAQKRRRKLLIGIISAISLLLISFLYMRMRKKEKDAKDRIYKLTYASQMQIMELEEKSLLIKHEEQRQLGMDLHDDLASTIAAIKIKIETELIDNSDPQQAERLQSVSRLLGDMYQRTRNKSHELFYGGENESEVPFSKRIKMITDTSFPVGKYNIEIQVDDDFMRLKIVSLPLKIQLLYIIQEAVANIIKHAAATHISILIYEQINGLILTIVDNGKGFNMVTPKKGVGLNSIRERVTILNGTLEINSGNKGTEITVTVPI